MAWHDDNNTTSMSASLVCSRRGLADNRLRLQRRSSFPEKGFCLTTVQERPSETSGCVADVRSRNNSIGKRTVLSSARTCCKNRQILLGDDFVTIFFMAARIL